MNSTIAGLAARTILPDEWEDYLKVRERTFGASSTPSQSEYLRRLTDLDRAIAVFDQGQIVATCVAWALEVSTPGRRTTGCGGLTLGQVLPTHRRRGILSGMLSLLQEDAKRRGEAIVAGWPSEAGIHNRFGWGVTTMAAELQIAAADLRLLSGFDTRGRVQFVEPSDAISRLKPIYEEARLATPGVPNRSDARWDGWLSHDNGRLKGADWAKDTGPRTFAEWDGRGYVAYRLQRTWAPQGPRYRALITELVALETEAYLGLWRWCADLDLVHTLVATLRPADETLWLALRNCRSLSYTVMDGLWTRIVDVPAALSSRLYNADGALVLEVVDGSGPWAQGTYLLEVEAGSPRCKPVRRLPDVTISAAALSSAYLGGISLFGLARAGRVDGHTPGAIRRMSSMFSWEPRPWCPWWF